MEAFLQWLTSTWTIVFNWCVNAWNTIDYWINRPIPIIGITGATLIAMAWFIFKNTSFGKRNIRKLKTNYNNLVNEFNNFKNGVALEEKNMKDFYENQLKISQAQVSEATRLIEIMAENSHNKKVKDALEEYKKNLEGINTELEIYIEERANNIMQNEYEERFKLIADQLDKINQLLEEQEHGQE